MLAEQHGESYVSSPPLMLGSFGVSCLLHKDHIFTESCWKGDGEDRTG